MKRNGYLKLIPVISFFLKTGLLPAQCVCIAPLYAEDYDSLSAFTYIQNTSGSLTSTNGQLSFNDPRGADYHKIFDFVPGFAVNSNYFSAACKFTMGDGNSPGHMLMMFTESDIDAFTLQYPFPKSHNDALGVVIISPNVPPSDFCCLNPTDPANPWGFAIFAKTDTTLDYQTYLNTIRMPWLNTTYWLLLQRISPTQAVLSVCLDSLYTIHIPGSPMCAGIQPDLGPLNYLQQGVLTPASNHRFISATLDNLTLCYGPVCEIQCPVSVADVPRGSPLFEILSNPSSGIISILLNRFNADPLKITMTDPTGRLVYQEDFVSRERIDLNPLNLSDGMYLVSIQEGIERQVKKIIFHRF